MADDIRFVGLDVHKKTISVATVLERPGEWCRYDGSIPHAPDALRRLCQKLQADDASSESVEDERPAAEDEGARPPGARSSGCLARSA